MPYRGIIGASFAYPAVPSPERARLALTDQGLRAAYGRLAAEAKQAFVLSTCLRLEVAAPGERDELEHILKVVFEGAALPDGAVYRSGGDELTHLFRIAAGVESPVLGEPEVLGQFRHAVEVGRREGVIDGSFEQLLGAAVNAGRSARRFLPESPHGSLAAVAAQVVGSLARIAVLGAGAMAGAVVDALNSLPAPPEVTLYVRRPDAVEIPDVEVRSIDESPQALATFPAVISATSAKRRLFEVESLLDALAVRKDDLLLVDMAMPPDFPIPDQTPGLRYVGVDDLADFARHTQPSDEADEYLAEAAAAAEVRILNQRRVKPVIAAILAQAETAIEEEVDRFAPRLGQDRAGREVMEQLARTVVRRVLHPPISFLSRDRDGGIAASTLAQAFGVEDDD